MSLYQQESGHLAAIFETKSQKDAQVALKNVPEAVPKNPSEPARDPLARFFRAWLVALRRG